MSSNPAMSVEQSSEPTVGEKWVQFGDQIRKAREYRDLSQRELGEIIGVSQTHVSRHELGVRPMVGEILEAYCDALDWSLELVLEFLEVDADEAKIAMARTQYRQLLRTIKPLITVQEAKTVRTFFAQMITERTGVPAEDFDQPFTMTGSTYRRSSKTPDDDL